jgi:hypothetical protein
MLLLKSVWGHTPRPWGYEVRVDFEDATGIHNEVLTFSKEPSAKELDAAVASRLSSVTERVAREVIEAAKPPDPTKEDLLSKVAVLEAEKVVLTREVAVLNARMVVK